MLYYLQTISLWGGIKLVQWFSRLSFSVRVFLFNTLFIVLLSAIVLSYFYFFVLGAETDKAQRNLDTLTGKTGQQLETLISEMDRTALQLAANPYVMDVFNNLPTHNNAMRNYFINEKLYSKEIVRYLNTFNIKRDMMARILLYNDQGDFISSGYLPTTNTAVLHFFDAQNPLGINQIHQYFSEDTPAFMAYVPPRKDPFSEDSPESLFSVVRKIQNYSIGDSETDRGYVEVQEPIRRFSDVFRGLDQDISILLLGEDGSRLYAGGPALSSELVNTLANTKNIHSYEESSAGWILSESQVSEMNGRVIFLLPQSSIFGHIQSIWLLILFAMAVMLMILLGTEYLVLRRLTRPLQKLHHSISAISIHHLEWEIQPGGDGDEFSRLNQAFEQLFSQLQTSVDDLVFARTEEVKSHVKALQAQMDPHFIHNILTIINGLAAEEEYQKIIETTDKLAEMLRYNASYIATEVTISEEIDHMLNYLDLMKIRYEDHFRYQLNNYAQDCDFLVPKLLLQPLVENCFKHGFSSQSPPWEITVTLYCQPAQWKIIIEDNGKGWKDTEIEAFWAAVSAFQQTKNRQSPASLKIGHLGLLNIYIRLYLIWGKAIIFELGKSDLGGAKITLGGHKL